MLRRFSSLFLIALIFNLNMVIPAVSYASAEETCSCHLDSADHQCHCEKHHKNHVAEGGSHKIKTTGGIPIIEGRTCNTSTPKADEFTVLNIPFLVPDFGSSIPLAQVSNLLDPTETIFHTVTITPYEKPPTV